MTNAENLESLAVYRIYHNKYYKMGIHAFQNVPTHERASVCEVYYKNYILHRAISVAAHVTGLRIDAASHNRETEATKRLEETEFSQFEFYMDYINWWCADIEKEEKSD